VRVRHLTHKPTPHVDPLATDVWGVGTVRKGWCWKQKPWTGAQQGVEGKRGITDTSHYSPTHNPRRREMNADIYALTALLFSFYATLFTLAL